MKSFESNNGLKKNFEQDIAVVHEKKKPLECSLCQYNFGCKGNLNKHIDVVHTKEGFRMEPSLSNTRI